MICCHQQLRLIRLAELMRCAMSKTIYTVQAVIEGYLRPMLAHNWDKGSLYSYRAFSFPSDMPYEAITQPVLFITGERDQPLTGGAKKARFCVLFALLFTQIIVSHGWQSLCSQFLQSQAGPLILSAHSSHCQSWLPRYIGAKMQQYLYFHKLHSLASLILCPAAGYSWLQLAMRAH